MANSNNPYDVLGINPGANDEEIKRAYKEKAKKYHPDKYIDNPLKDLADDKMRKINAAYDELARKGSAGGSSRSTYGNNSYSPNYRQQQNAYAYRSYSNNGSYGNNSANTYNIKRWPRYYYLMLALILILFSFGGSYLSSIMNSGASEDPYSNASGYEDEYGYPPEEEYGEGEADTAESDPAVAYVMSGTLEDYPGVTIADAVGDYFSEVSWNHYQGNSGEDIIEALGYVKDNQSEVLALHFSYDESGKISLDWAGNDYDDQITTAQLDNYKSEIFGSGGSVNGRDT